MRNDALKNVALNEKPGARFFQDAVDGIREVAAPIGLVLFRSERDLDFEEECRSLEGVGQLLEGMGKEDGEFTPVDVDFQVLFFCRIQVKGREAIGGLAYV